MNTAFFILTARPTLFLNAFADELAGQLPNVFLCSDQDSDQRPKIASFLHITDENARSARYFNSSPLIMKTPIAWDKGLYFMAKGDFEFGWFCEDDVLFASPNAAASLIQSFAASYADLICQEAFSPSDRPSWPHWAFAAPFEKQHASGAFLPLCRISRRLAVCVDDYVRRNGSLSFIETMLPSLVREFSLTSEFITTLTLQSFRYRPEFPLWELLERNALHSCDIFHPVKSDIAKEKFIQRRQFNVLELTALRAFAGTMLFARRVRYAIKRAKQNISHSTIRSHAKPIK